MLGKNILFISLNKFTANVLYVKYISGNYEIDFSELRNLPINWFNKFTSYEFVKIFLQELCQNYHIEISEINIIITSSYIEENVLQEINAKFILSKNVDYTLIESFLSTLLDLSELDFFKLDYESIIYSNSEIFKYARADNPNVILKKAYEENLPNLNNLLKPINRIPSFSRAFIPFLVSTLLDHELVIKSHNVILSGETFVNIAEEDILLFPLLCENRKGVVDVFIDSKNILSLFKPLKDSSIGLLKTSVNSSIKHIATLVRIKSNKKGFKAGVVGRINISDDNGFRSIYPIYNDINILKVSGLGKVNFDLEIPFYIDEVKKDLNIKNYLIIDTRESNLSINSFNLYTSLKDILE